MPLAKTEFSSPELEKKVKNLPHKPGCYIYYNKDHQVIYVGKAIDLRKRVISYFNRVHNIKTTRLVRDIVDMDYFVVNNEAESFLLEENLIKKYRPRYNIILNDDKHYPYIIITNEKDPQYKYVRKYDKKALRSYGPMPQGSNARNLMRILERVYPLRRCKGNLGKPCLYYNIGQCSGACFKDVPWDYYKEQISKVDRFFRGHTDELRDELTKRMNIASDNLQFEEASRIKDLLVSLDYAASTQQVVIDNLKNIDVMSAYYDDEKISFVTLFYRGGKLLFKDKSVIANSGQDMESLFENYILQIYSKNIVPDQLIIPNEVGFENLREDVKAVATHPISKEEKSLEELAKDNAKQAIEYAELNSQTVNNNEEEVLKQLQKLLGLKKYPQRIEMFDISNIGDEFVTGSTVVWIGGKPAKNEFRKYNIEIEEQDDASRMSNMAYRRFQKALVEKRQLPDLLIVDGGIIQLRAVKQVMDSLGLSRIPVIGLIKNEHHNTEKILTMDEQEIPLDKQTPLYNLLANIQLRVDTFAKSGFRQKQNSNFLTEDLKQIKGLGPKKIQELNKKYLTKGDMQKASFEELDNIIHNPETTKRLKDYLDKQFGKQK